MKWGEFKRLIGYTEPESEPIPREQKIDRSMMFAVPNDEGWWLAVHQLLDEAEWETIQDARNYVWANPDRSKSAISAGEGIAIFRQKLIDTRNAALQARIRGGELNAIQKNSA